jgi:membrane-associated phospholipid phosphatase
MRFCSLAGTAAFALASLSPSGVPLLGQATVTPGPMVTVKDAAWLGAVTAASIGIMQLDSRIARRSQDSSLQRNKTLQNLYTGFNLINEKSLFGAGVLTYAGARFAHARSTADIAFHATEAVFISGAIGTVARGIIGRSRPFVTADRDAYDYRSWKGFTELKYRSFPSLHSSAAFASAAVVATEMKYRGAKHQRIVAPLLYTLAAGPGLSRIYGDKHWTSDVVLGAALGIVAGVGTVRYAHSHPHNRVDRWFLGHASATSGREGPMVALGWTF